MAMVFFPNEQINLYEYTDSETLDLYGNPKKAYVYVTTVPCNFQVMTPKDSLQEFGEILEDTYKIYVDVDVTVSPTTVIELVRDNSQYNVTGTPIVNNHFLQTQHQKLVVQKIHKPIRLPPIETETEETTTDSGDEP